MDEPREIVTDLLERTGTLERELRRWRRCALLAALGIAACAATGISSRPSPGVAGDQGVLRVRGLVVEDVEGRPRIVLGAPTPALDRRKRSDATVSLVFLDADGDDRLVLGEQPDPMIEGHVVPRRSPAVGLNIQDGGGNERGGFGLLETGLVVLGLDTGNGREGISLSVDDVLGASALLMASRKGGFERVGLYVDDERALVKVADTRGAERLLLMAGSTEEPRLLVLDADHATQRDLLSGEKR